VRRSAPVRCAGLASSRRAARAPRRPRRRVERHRAVFPGLEVRLCAAPTNAERVQTMTMSEPAEKSDPVYWQARRAALSTVHAITVLSPELTAHAMPSAMKMPLRSSRNAPKFWGVQAPEKPVADTEQE